MVVVLGMMVGLLMFIVSYIVLPQTLNSIAGWVGGGGGW